MSQPLQWIATRPLTSDDPAQPQAEVRLGVPEFVATYEWRCAYQVDLGPGKDAVRHAYGVDAFQALTLALVGIRVHLETSGFTFTYEGGEPGDHGLPSFIPQFYGLEFAQRMEQLVTEETEKYATQLINRARS